MARIVVCGGSVIGLATAMMLADDGHDVTVLESDPSPAPEDPARAWDRWDRKGVAQFHQPHNLLARAHQVLDATLPGMTDALRDAGCLQVDPMALLPPTFTDRSSRPDDDRFRSVTGRRPVLEATFANAAAQRSGVTVRRGVIVRGLLSASSNGVPHVVGVRLEGGEELAADLVVDAMGRRTKLAEWLRALGGKPPVVESEDSGFVYYTRYFSGPEQPAAQGPPLAELGTISVFTIGSDNDTWSITAFGASADTALRGLRDTDAFTRVLGACPWQAHWLDGKPISDVVAMAGILDQHRTFVVDGTPIATGVVAVGDACASTNPSAGRGMSVGLRHAQLLRDAVRDGLDDTLVHRFAESTERDVTPFFRNQVAEDRARFAEMDALRAGGEPPPADPTRRALGAALMHDADVFRGMLDMANCLALPQEVFARPGFMDRVTAYADQPAMSLPGPDRAELLDLIG